jgi:phage terminase large subunit GpA-like protein
MSVEQELVERWSLGWNPTEKLSLSVWAEKHFQLSPEYSSKTGELRLFGWQREILDSFTDPEVEEIVLMTGTQLIKTLFLQVAIAYIVAEAPAPILLAQYKAEDAEHFSKERLAPMIRDIAVIRERVSPAKGRDGSNTTLFKAFPGGSISLVGAQAAGNAARRSICYGLLDEVDKYGNTSEGDFIALVRERLVTYGSRKKLALACSPTKKHSSKIAKAYAETDQRQPWVPCHACGAAQVLKWSQVQWNNNLAIEDRPSSAYYECEQCGAHWNDAQRWAACEHTDWRPRRPFAGKRGYWISHLYSPWKTLGTVVRDFLAAKAQGREALQVFVNTNLAELWEEEGETPQPELLMGRRESYPFGSEPAIPNENAVVPMRALFLTCFVDVQDNRLEYEVVGWGRGKETWSVAYGVIRVYDETGRESLPTSNQAVWAELEKVLATDWKHEGGKTMPIMVMGIDTGFRPKPVYEFAKRHPQPAYGPAGLKVFAARTVIPTKGSSTERFRLIAAVSKEDAARKRQGVRIVSVGTGVAKQELFDNLRLPKPSNGISFPGYCHFPMYDEEFFTGLCNEKRVMHDDDSITWEKLGRNEPLDCRVGNRAVAAVFGIERFGDKQWELLERDLDVVKIQPAVGDAPIVAVVERPADQASRRGWMQQTGGGSWFGGANRGGWLSR